MLLVLFFPMFFFLCYVLVGMQIGCRYWVPVLILLVSEYWVSVVVLYVVSLRWVSIWILVCQALRSHRWPCFGWCAHSVARGVPKKRPKV